MVRNFLALSFSLLVFSFSLASSAQEADEEVQAKFPLGADFYVSNSVGAAAISKETYQQEPFVSSSLYLYPHVKFGPFWGEREFRTHVEISGNVEWFGKNNPIAGSFGNKLSFGDVKIRSELRKALYDKALGLSFTPALKVELPLSKGSRSSNRIVGLGGYFNATFSKWGFFFTYKPVALGYVHSENYKADDCSDDASAEDKLPNGKCKIAGRQTQAIVKNGLFTGYTYGDHTLTLGFRTFHQFLRDANQGEKAEKTPSSGVMEATLGIVEYSYNLPVSVPTTISLGVAGYQSPYDANKGLRVPFFDFSEPSKNETEAYVAVNVTI